MENIDVTTESAETINEIADSSTPAARYAQAMREVMDGLLAVADLDSEERTDYDTLGRLMARAGYMWVCISPECGCVNHLIDRRCINCRGRRPKKRDVPKPDVMA